MYMMKTFNGDCSMKKLIYTLGIIAAAAFTFSSCQKEQSIEQPLGKLVTVSFTAEKAGLDTRTAAVEGENEVSFIWTEEDLTNIKLFTVGEDADGKEVLTVVANPTITKVSDTKLTIAGKVAPNATYTFRAVLSGKWTNKNHPRLSETQSPSTSNFDPTADILISDDMEVTVGAAEEGEATVTTSALEMVFRRPVVVNKMTLKNLKKGEAIDKVVITSNKDIAGYVYSDSKTAVGDKKIITLNYNKAVTVPEGGLFPVYFTTIPGTGNSLTVEVTTDQFVYTKSFAEGKFVDFNLGQFTKFNLALPAGVANTALSLPIEDSMEWAVNGTDGTVVLNVADIPVSQNGKKVYSEADYLYKGIDGLKFGSKDFRGVLTTSEINLSSAYNIAVSAKTWEGTSGADESQVEFLVDGVSVYKSDNLSTEYQTYYFNAPAATSKSKIAIKIDGKRGYIKDLTIKSGTYVAPPVIKVTSANPFEVSNENDLYAIEYTISNPASGVSISATSDVEWIHDFDYDTAGEVGFEVDAQQAGAASRSGIITLTYTGAKSVKVTVNQAAAAGVTTYYYVPMTEAPSDWTNETYIVVAGTSVLNTSATSSWGGYTSVTKETDGSIKMTSDLEKCELVATGSASAGYQLQFTKADTQYYLNPLTSKSFALSTTASGTLNLSTSAITNHASTSWMLRLNGTSGFRWYSSTTGSAAVLYKKVAN